MNSFLIEKHGELNIVSIRNLEPLILTDNELLDFLKQKRDEKTSIGLQNDPYSDNVLQSSSPNMAIPSRSNKSVEDDAVGLKSETSTYSSAVSPDVRAWIEKCDEVTVAATLKSAESKRAIEELRRKCEELENKYSITLKNRIRRESSAQFVRKVLNEINFQRVQESMEATLNAARMSNGGIVKSEPSISLNKTDWSGSSLNSATGDDIFEVTQQTFRDTSQTLVDEVLNTAIAQCSGTHKLTFSVPDLTIDGLLKSDVPSKHKDMHMKYEAVLLNLQKEYNESQRVIRKLHKRQLQLETSKVTPRVVRFANPITQFDLPSAPGQESIVANTGEVPGATALDTVCENGTDGTISTGHVSDLSSDMNPIDLNDKDTNRDIPEKSLEDDEGGAEEEDVNEDKYIQDVMELLASETSAVLLHGCISGLSMMGEMQLQQAQEVSVIASTIPDIDELEPEEYLEVVASVREIRNFLFTPGIDSEDNQSGDCNDSVYFRPHESCFSPDRGSMSSLDGWSVLGPGVGTREESIYVSGEDGTSVEGSRVDDEYGDTIKCESVFMEGSDDVEYDYDGSLIVDMEALNKSMFEDFTESLFEPTEDDFELDRRISVVDMGALERELQVLSHETSTRSVTLSRRWQEETEER